jgi:hypothetical protein
MNAVILTPMTVRTAQEEYHAGFDFYCTSHRTKEWPQANEVATWSAAFLKGYNHAADAQVEAEYATYRGNRNSFGDLTEWGF